VGLRLIAVVVAFAWLVACAGASASLNPAGPAATDAASDTPAVFPPKLASDFRAVPGMNGWTVFKLSPPQRDQQLAAMEADGVKVVRSDSPWNEIEPVPPGPTGHIYQWSGFDSWVSTLAKHHLTWEPLVDFSVWWAKTCSGNCAPTTDSTYATFAQAIAAKYGANGSFWVQNPQLPYYPVQIFEIWNEEASQTFWVPPPRFATLYSASRAAIHAVDPTASVIVGGLADDSQSYNPSKDYPAAYVYQMFTADPGLRGNVDGFGLHPYGTTAVDAVNWTIHFRRVLDQLGEATAPIDITELGWTTGNASRETWRAGTMSTVALELSRSDCGIRLFEPYDWVNPGVDPPSDFGLIDPTALNTTLRPAGAAWFKALEEAATMPALPLCHPVIPKPRTERVRHHMRAAKHRRQGRH
jgi:hypothetical protein